MRTEFLPLTVDRLTVDAMDPTDHNLRKVQAYINHIPADSVKPSNTRISLAERAMRSV
jgi:hypothetical protein